MTHSLKCLLFVLAATFCKAGERNILFIGNSYTQQISKTVTELFYREGLDANFEFMTVGGKTLEFHLNHPPTLDRIRSKEWQIIILQDQSQVPALPGKYTRSFHSAVSDFSRLFEQLDHRPTVCLYMTWGRRDGDSRNQKSFPDFPTMQRKLAENYRRAARNSGSLVVPVGLAFEAIYGSDKDLFKSLYAADGSHPSELGAYMAACVFIETLTNRDAAQIKWNGSLDSSVAKVLKQAAKQASN